EWVGGVAGGSGEERLAERLLAEDHPVLDGPIVAPQADGIDEDELLHPRGQDGRELAGEHSAEGVADERGLFEPEPVEQLAVIDDEVQPRVELVHRLRIAGSGAGVVRRIDSVSGGQAVEKVAVRPQPPRAVQEDERRSRANDLDVSLDAVLPEAKSANGHAAYLVRIRLRPRRPRDGERAGAG